MSQINKLKELQQNKQIKSSKQLFQNLVVINVGCEPVQHFPKLEKNGVKVKDEKGRNVRSEISDGWTYTFSEFGTARKIMIVLSERKNLELLTAYKIAGLGYDIKNANLVFIDTKGQIAKFE